MKTTIIDEFLHFEPETPEEEQFLSNISSFSVVTIHKLEGEKLTKVTFHANRNWPATFPLVISRS